MHFYFLLISSLVFSTAWAEAEQKTPTHIVEKKIEKKTDAEAVEKAEVKKPKLPLFQNDPEKGFEFNSSNVYRARTAKEFKTNVIEASQDHPVVVDFGMKWCGPCKEAAPTFGKIADAFVGRNVDFIACVGTGKTFLDDPIIWDAGLLAVPTWKVYYKGKIVECPEKDTDGVRACLEFAGYK